MAKTYRVVFRTEARDDLADLYDYIADDSGVRRAGAYIERVEAACMTLSLFPMRGTKREDFGPGVRVVGFERRVAIAFRVLSDEVEILRVLYGGRDLGARFAPEN